VRERLVDAMLETETRFKQADAKRSHYHGIREGSLGYGVTSRQPLTEQGNHFDPRDVTNPC